MPEIFCAGVPRDLGRDMGRCCVDRIRARVGRPSLFQRLRDGFALASSEANWLRDVRRYFPHHFEWLEALSRAAGVSLPALARASASAFAAERHAALVVAEVEGRVCVYRRAPPAAVVRRVDPEGRFASIEYAAAILSAPWIGVNGAGLAIAASGGVDPVRGRCAHMALFTCDCLQRFDALDSSIDWCMGRPAAPGGALVIVDAQGNAGAVVGMSGKRRVVSLDDGVLVVAEDPKLRVTHGNALRKLRDDAAAFEAQLRALLVRGSDEQLAVADPAQRQLRVGDATYSF